MCYSALVKQRAKDLGIEFFARIQYDLYKDIFERRRNGERLLINKAMEYEFTHLASSPVENEIKVAILEWHKNQISECERVLFEQKKRLADAERKLALKVTKAAENDRRISTDKIQKALRDIESHKSLEITSELDERIFPGHYFSLLALDERGEKVIMPVRYLMRPNGQTADFDSKFNGCYNARLDSLQRVAWWKSSLEKRRGLMVVKKFYENVAAEDYGKKFTIVGESSKKKNLVLCFQPRDVEYMYIPTLWDIWEKPGEPKLYSAALITDEPAPEIAEAGHDRTPIFLKKSAVDDWLTAKTSKDALEVLSQREKPYYQHALVG